MTFPSSPILWKFHYLLVLHPGFYHMVQTITTAFPKKKKHAQSTVCVCVFVISGAGVGLFSLCYTVDEP